MFEEDEETPNADGRQFDAVGKYEEPQEPGAGSIGPSIPEAPDLSMSAADADPAIQQHFWTLVLLCNVAIAALSIGAMMVGFGTHPTLGLQVLLAGVIISIYGVYRYRNARAEIAERAGADDAEAEDNG